MSGSGNWEADNVSASPNGTALFDIEVYGPGSGPPGGTPIASVVVDQPQPAQVVLMSYSGTRSEEWAKSDPCNSGSNSGKDGDNVRWSYDQGGFLRQWASADEQQQNPPYDTTTAVSAGFSSIVPPWEFASVSDGIAGPFGCGDQSLSEARRTETRVMIEPEGQAPIGESRLYLVRAKALQFAPPTIVDALYTHSELMSGSQTNYAGTIPISPDTLQINGAMLANTGETDVGGATGGATLVQAPAGVRPEATVVATQVQGYKDYTSNIKVDPVKPSIMVNGVKLDENRVVTNFIVGQILTFSNYDLQLPTNLVSRSVQWTFEGHFLNDSNQPCPDCSVNYITNSAKLTNDTTTAWWVSGNFSPPAIYTATLRQDIRLNNGSVISTTTTGLLNMFRPQAQIAATTGPLVLDTNMAIAPDCATKFGLHYGNPSGCGGTPGIVFTNSCNLPPGFSGDFQWVQVITSVLLRYQTNDTSGTWIRRAATNVLDEFYPYDNNAFRTEDSPGANIDGPPFCQSKRLTDARTFEMWIEFKPAAGSAQWVPLRKVDWNYSGEAILTGTNCSPSDWTGTNFTHSPNPADTDTQQYPRWTNNITHISFEPE